MLTTVPNLLRYPGDSGPYRNPHRVTFDALSHHRYLISAPHPNFRAPRNGYELRIFLDEVTAAALAHLFGVRSRTDVDAVTPAAVLAAFHVYAYAHIWCLVPGSRGVAFRTGRGVMFAETIAAGERLAGAEGLAAEDAEGMLRFTEQADNSSKK